MEINRYIGKELHSLFNLIRRKRAEISAKCDADPSTILHYRTIVFLHINKENDVFQRDIEQDFEVRRPTATKFLQLMEQNGLITRAGVDYDARLKRIILTDKGNDLIGTAAEKMAEYERQLTEGLTEDEISAFITTIRKIKKNLE